MAVRRTVAPAPAPVIDGVNFMDDGLYSGGFTLPPGKYVWVDLTVMNWKPDKGTQPAKLGLMITMIPLSDPIEAHKQTQFYSFGSNADKSYAPNPITGKGIVPIPGAPASGLKNSTNWAVLRKSLLDGGLPPGILTNDFSAIEGIWVDMTLADEPAERAGFQSNTAEVAAAPYVPKKIAVVLEVLAGPWDPSNPGGWPTAPVIFDDSGTATVTAPITKVNGAARPPLTAATTVAAAADESIQGAAENAINTVLEKNANGIPRIQLRTQVYNILKPSGEDMANAVLATFFDPAGALDKMLGVFGYKTQGPHVVPLG